MDKGRIMFESVVRIEVGEVKRSEWETSEEGETSDDEEYCKRDRDIVTLSKGSEKHWDGYVSS